MKTFQALLAACVVLTQCACAANASTSFAMTVDTSSIAGTGAILLMQYDSFGVTPGTTDLNIANFQTTGSLAGGSQTTGGTVSGALPGTVTFVNDPGFNYYAQNITLGSTISFIGNFGGAPPVNPLDAPDFSFSILNAAGDTFLLTGDPSGVIGEVHLNADGSFTPQSFPNGGGPSVARFASVPEPRSGAIFLIGAMLLGLAAFKNRSRLS